MTAIQSGKNAIAPIAARIQQQQAAMDKPLDLINRDDIEVLQGLLADIDQYLTDIETKMSVALSPSELLPLSMKRRRLMRHRYYANQRLARIVANRLTANL